MAAPGRGERTFGLVECEAIVSKQVAHWNAHGFGTRLGWDDGRCIGGSLIQHYLVAGRSEVEIGWTVARDRWEQGIATELGRNAFAASQSLGLQRVVAFTRNDNLASRRVTDKLRVAYELDFQHAGLPHVL